MCQKIARSFCRDFYRNFCRNLFSNLFEFLKSSYVIGNVFQSVGNKTYGFLTFWFKNLWWELFSAIERVVTFQQYFFSFKKPIFSRQQFELFFEKQYSFKSAFVGALPTFQNLQFGREFSRFLPVSGKSSSNPRL